MITNLQIATKLEAVDQAFRERFSIPLWAEVPVADLTEISRPVNSVDDLRLRSINLMAVFDALNKSEFNRRSGVKDKYTRDSFVSLLKNEFPNDQQLIQNDIQTVLGAIAHLRNHFSHRHRPMNARDLNCIGVQDVLADPVDTWNKVQHRLIALLDKTLELLNGNSVASISEHELSAKPLRIVVQETYERYKEYLEDPGISSMLREIMDKGELLDTELALRYNVSIKELRNRLFPLLDKVVRIQPHNSVSTKLRVNGPMEAALQNPDEWLKDEVT